MNEKKKSRQERLFDLFMDEEAFRELKKGQDKRLKQLAETYDLSLEELRIARDGLLALKKTAGEILKTRTLYP